MYFPTSAATQLSALPLLPHETLESIIGLVASPNRSLFCTLTRGSLSVWRVRPSTVVASLSRSEASLDHHGRNVQAYWSPDGTSIIVQTALSFLVLVTLHYDPDVSATVYSSSSLPVSSLRHFPPGPGEEVALRPLHLSLEGVIRVQGVLLSVSPRKDYIYFSTSNPPAVQRIPWPSLESDDESDDDSMHRDTALGHETWLLNDFELPWLLQSDAFVTDISQSRHSGVETWITSDGRAYWVQLDEVSSVAGSSDMRANTSFESPRFEAAAFTSATNGTSHSQWRGTCIYDNEPPRSQQKQKALYPEGTPEYYKLYEEPRKAVCIAVNTKFSLFATGVRSGSVLLSNLPSAEGGASNAEELRIPRNYGQHKTGSVCTMEWSSDGYVLAVGWECGWAVWSVGGRCLAWAFGVEDSVDPDRFRDSFMYGVQALFWVPGNFEVIALAQSSSLGPDGQLFSIPFAKSAVTEQQTPDNTRYAFLQMDDRVLVYRGADQPDMSVINPESDVWQRIKIPLDYMSSNWPIRYSAISVDARFIAVAGRRGLLHYSTTSGRWKMFEDRSQEQAFAVRGGLVWFHHVLIAAIDHNRSYQIRLYSRDLDLSSQNILHRELLPSPVITLSIVDNSLLVYTADNTLSHFLIVPTDDTIELHVCGSISFNGIIIAPSVVRGLSWMIPKAHKQFGDPHEDLAVATVLMMIGGKLVLLRPQKFASQEVKYDMTILADRIEFCWIHLRGIGTLENSLWGYDGQAIRVWLNALNIEAGSMTPLHNSFASVEENVSIALDFYPLSVLMDKGIIIGVESETIARQAFTFVMFRQSTSSHLFLHHILQCHLESKRIDEAVVFASHYETLIYFAHALEILLHTVVESEADTEVEKIAEDAESSVLPAVVEFLDHFDCALDVVVGCARKTELTRWRRLFNVVGPPKSLFESCLAMNRLKTAGSYLLILHNLDPSDEVNEDGVRLLRKAIDSHDWQLCQELLRFFHSIDDTGLALKEVLAKTNIVESSEFLSLNGSVDSIAA